MNLSKKKFKEFRDCSRIFKDLRGFSRMFKETVLGFSLMLMDFQGILKGVCRLDYDTPSAEEDPLAASSTQSMNTEAMPNLNLQRTPAEITCNIDYT